MAGQIGTNEQLENSRLLNQIVQKVRQSTHTITKAMCTKKRVTASSRTPSTLVNN